MSTARAARLELVCDDEEFLYHVRKINGCSVTADYYLHVYPHAAHHCQAAEHAQRAYRAADAYLIEAGIEDNGQRQDIIHMAEQLL